MIKPHVNSAFASGASNAECAVLQFDWMVTRLGAHGGVHRGVTLSPLRPRKVSASERVWGSPHCGEDRCEGHRCEGHRTVGVTARCGSSHSVDHRTVGVTVVRVTAADSAHAARYTPLNYCNVDYCGDPAPLFAARARALAKRSRPAHRLLSLTKQQTSDHPFPSAAPCGDGDDDDRLLQVVRF